MSSRRLLVLTDGLPAQDSWFKAQLSVDAKEFEENEQRETMSASRRRHLASAYRKVPDHLRPPELREVS